MIAIHPTKGSFSDRWIAYCEKNSIPFKLINCYSNDIIKDLKGCSALMWHFSQNIPTDILLAKSLVFTCYQLGLKFFPDFNTSWHFDDKAAQKYLLEMSGTPFVPTWVFYNKKEATTWAKTTSFPKVFKLKGGAGAQNVVLVKSESQCIQLINKAFGRGFSNYDALGSLKERWRKYRKGLVGFYEVFKGVLRLYEKPPYTKVKGRDYGYVYFQEFIPNNDSDIRIIVIGENAFGIKRMVRENDFRASGSGSIVYDKSQIDERCVQLAFGLTQKLNAQCLAFDYVIDAQNNPLLIEISYGYAVAAYDQCEGFWDNQLNWYSGPFDHCGWMVELVVK
jgi:hypothetical protein